MVRVDDEIELVPAQPAHADGYAAHVQRDRRRMARWLAWVEATETADDVRAFLVSVEERRAKDLGEMYAIVVGGELAGAIDIHDVNRLHGFAALGYWLGSGFGGRGIMTRAARAASELAFTQHRLERLEILVAVENSASRAVAERAGFQFEAVLRRRLWAPQGHDDAALYARLKP